MVLTGRRRIESMSALTAAFIIGTVVHAQTLSPSTQNKTLVPTYWPTLPPTLTATSDGGTTNDSSSSPSVLSTSSGSTDLPFNEIVQFPTPAPIDNTVTTAPPFNEIIQFPTPVPGTPPPAAPSGETKIPTYSPTGLPTTLNPTPSSSSDGGGEGASYSPSPSISSSSGGSITESPSPAGTILSPSAVPTTNTTSGLESSLLPTLDPTISGSESSSSSSIPISSTLPTVSTSSLSSTSPTTSTPLSSSPTLGSSSPSTGTSSSPPTTYVPTTVAPTVSVPTISTDSTNEPTTLPPTFASITSAPTMAPSPIRIFTNQPTVATTPAPFSITIFTNPPTLDDESAAPTTAMPQVPTTPKPTREPIVFDHALHTYDMTVYHKKEAEENEIPHLDHDKVQAKYEVGEAGGVTRAIAPHLFVESEAVEHLKNEENQEVTHGHQDDTDVSYTGSFVSGSSSPDLLNEGEDVARISSPHLFTESEAAQRLRDEIISSNIYVSKDSLDNRVRMNNGSKEKMWNVIVIIASFGFTWMLL